MKRFLFLLGVLLLLVNESYSQVGDYTSISGGFNTYIIDMNLKRSAGKTRYNLYYGMGASYGMSFKENLNFKGGLDVFYFEPKNIRGYYDFCSSTDPDASCLPIVSTMQVHLPLQVEFYVNSNYRTYKTFFTAGVVPVLSFTEKVEMIEFDGVLNEVDHYEIRNNGLKAQDIYMVASVANEILLFGNFRFFVEPSVRFSMRFNQSDYSNAMHYFMIRSGFRVRLEKK